MNFNSAMDIVSTTLREVGSDIKSEDYDGLVVKELKPSNTLDIGRTSNQTHIAMTGQQMDIFPYLRSDGYFDDSIDDPELKKYFISQIPVYLAKSNLEYLSVNIKKQYDSNFINTHTSIVRSKRKEQSNQIQASILEFDGSEFIQFRKALHSGSYLIILKRKYKFEYEFFGVVSGKDELKNLNNKFFKKATSTAVAVDKLINNSYAETKDKHDFQLGNNIIYYGAPGTGKSWRVTQEIKKSYPNFETEASQEAQFVFRTTLHPEYTYSDFIGQILPVTQKDEIKYEFTPGVFTRALEKAISLEQQNQPVYLVLEELSRANVAAVLGDLFQLLDRKDGVSEYSISNPIIAKHIYHAGDEKNQDGSFNIKEQELINKKIYLPKNLFILGTVNTNDQNVFVMDTAFKRRFEWEYVSTKPVSKNGAYLNNPCLDIGGGVLVEWTVFYQKLNLYITKNMMLGEDKQVGQFFLKFDDINNETANLKQLQNKLLQYLWDDIEKAAFNKTLFDNIDNYADLYEKFGNKEPVFNSEFLDTLSPVDNQETQSTGDYADGKE
ncbi:AAA family ATPase [Lactococcus garvieae]|uniref:AAA family ATPase n=1 Tax=Lactococcus garvieae TaxID=1363 RepID=UPI003852E25E